MPIPLHRLAAPLLALAALAPVCQAEQFTLATEEYAPYNMSSSKDQVTGVSTDIVRELMKLGGYDYTIAIYPWARAIQMARQLVNTCVFSMSRTPERENLYKWVGPLVYNDWSIFARVSASRPQNMEALQNARIGSYQGDAIVSWLQARGYYVDVAPSDEVNPRKLMSNHLDFWATGKLIGLYRLHQQGLDKQIVPVLTFNRSEMYLACQKDMPDDTVNRLNQLLKTMQKNGSVRRVYEKYGYTP